MYLLSPFRWGYVGLFFELAEEMAFVGIPCAAGDFGLRRFRFLEEDDFCFFYAQFVYPLAESLLFTGVDMGREILVVCDKFGSQNIYYDSLFGKSLVGNPEFDAFFEQGKNVVSDGFNIVAGLFCFGRFICHYLLYNFLKQVRIIQKAYGEKSIEDIEYDGEYKGDKDGDEHRGQQRRDANKQCGEKRKSNPAQSSGFLV
jgi:hypothetical protein